MISHQAEHVNFPVHKKGSSDLTNEAKAYLHGKELQALIDVPEESFICFVLATDIACYHFKAVESWFPKYRAYIEMPIDVWSILKHYKTQNGVFATRKLKGFRELDISMFLHMQSSVRKERIELEKFLASLKDSFSPREIERMTLQAIPRYIGRSFLSNYVRVGNQSHY
jgi:hypothetical protein